jgi:hypothetical protein
VAVLDPQPADGADDADDALVQPLVSAPRRRRSRTVVLSASSP